MQNGKTEGVNDRQNKTDVQKLIKRKQDTLTSRLRTSGSHSNYFPCTSKTNFSTGRSRMADFTMTFTLRTSLFLSGKNLLDPTQGPRIP